MDRSQVQYCRLVRSERRSAALHRPASLQPAPQIILKLRSKNIGNAGSRRPGSFVLIDVLLEAIAGHLTIVGRGHSFSRARSPSSVVTIMPARSYVTDEDPESRI